MQRDGLGWYAGTQVGLRECPYWRADQHGESQQGKKGIPKKRWSSMGYQSPRMVEESILME